MNGVAGEVSADDVAILDGRTGPIRGSTYMGRAPIEGGGIIGGGMVDSPMEDGGGGGGIIEGATDGRAIVGWVIYCGTVDGCRGT
jgi:hypothetical protein